MTGSILHSMLLPEGICYLTPDLPRARLSIVTAQYYEHELRHLKIIRTPNMFSRRMELDAIDRRETSCEKSEENMLQYNPVQENP